MKRKYGILIILAIVLAAIGAVAVYNRETVVQEDPESDSSIRAKFDCDRLTDDARATDVFCANPEWYRNPQISEEDYRDHLNCTERINSPVSSEENAEIDPVFQETYKICTDTDTFNEEFTKFQQQLEKLKQQKR